ncbi:MAG: MBL fold metallo-hydrolase [Nitrospirota bacterium]|nr:MBL fold metallo-hydrolase [Nitrospirota bacterium]MDE3219080.1 MBL fold metallo-hydrolase [Nitrospirota bacterium]
MNTTVVRMTYVGGPTALLEWGGLRLLTDPSFDPSGTIYTTPSYSLRKTMDPAVGPDALGPFDAILLSHDHHFDNLDHSGRTLVTRTRPVFTTVAGAPRLGGGAIGLVPWQSLEIGAPNGRVLTITGTPARHGPAHADRGPVTGFVLSFQDDPGNAIYLSGDTVWYEGVREVSQRFSIRMAVLFMGAARVPAVGDWPLTFTASEGVETARAFSDATIIPVHYEGWDHFSESRTEIARTFEEAGLSHRLRWLPAGSPTDVAITPAASGSRRS